MIIKDQLNREIQFDAPPERIVSLVPSLTELICDLGLKEKLVGITKFCVHPREIKKQAQIIGGTKKIKLKDCLELKPDFVLANKEENIEHQVKALSKEGISVYVSDISNHADVKNLIEQLGELFNVESSANGLIDELDTTITELQSVRLAKTLKAAYLIWKNPYMAAGGDTYISYMLDKIGFKNALNEEQRYPVLDESRLKSLDMDVILLSSEPFPFKQSHVKELTELTGKKVLLVDGEFFSWYGTRILHMPQYPEQLTSQL